MTSDKTSGTYFPALDGLRTIAFLLVFFYHAFSPVFKSSIFPAFVQRQHLGVFGAWGVSVFFVLSGFLISYLLLKEIKAFGRLSLWKFYMRRNLRIWPLYFLTMLFVFVIYPLISKNGPTDSNPWYFFTFLSNFDVLRTQLSGGNDSMSGNVAWSLAVEEQFYIVWPLLFLMLGFVRSIWGILAVLFTCIAFRLWGSDIGMVLHFHTLAVCGDLAMGGLLAYLVHHSERFKDFFSDMGLGLKFMFYIIGLACLGAFKFYEPMGRMVHVLFFTFIVADQAFGKQWFGKLSNYKLLQKGGLYTYSLYLLHPLALLLCEALFENINTDWIRTLTIALAALPISVGMALLSYKYIERPFLKLKSRFTRVNSGH